MSAITSRQRRANDRRRIAADAQRWCRLVATIRKTVLREGLGDPIGTDGPVIEISAFRRDPDAIGHMHAHGRDEHGEMWRIRSLRTGRVHRWRNATFAEVPKSALRLLPRGGKEMR